MVEYAKRTCHHCGCRDIQPNMYKIEVTRDTGTSRSNMSGMTVLGAFFGSKVATRALARRVWSSGGRTYSRTSTIWACGRCAKIRHFRFPAKIWLTIGAVLIGLLVSLETLEKYGFIEKPTPRLQQTQTTP